jgi:putative nucleotidyltransferase with HDIG domain
MVIPSCRYLLSNSLPGALRIGQASFLLHLRSIPCPDQWRSCLFSISASLKPGRDRGILESSSSTARGDIIMVEIDVGQCYSETTDPIFKYTDMNMQKLNTRTLDTVAHSLGFRDKYSEGHTERVSRYAQRLARRLKLPADMVEDIRIAGLLHDIGKVGFSDRVFRSEERRPTKTLLREIKKHPENGRIILTALGLSEPIIEYVYAHHERRDGSGYPRGLKGDEIPLGARIISIADTFDAITTDRPYQLAKTLKEAFAILRTMRGKSFDPEFVDAFIDMIREEGA